MNLRDESEACAPPHQERAGTGIFALCLPSQVVAQGFAQSFLLIMDRVEQESPGTPAGGKGNKAPLHFCPVAAVNGAHGTSRHPDLAPCSPRGVPGNPPCAATPGQGALVDAMDTNSYTPKSHTNPPFLPPESKSPLTQQSHI